LDFKALRGDGFLRLAPELEDFRLAMGHEMVEGLMAVKNTPSPADASPEFPLANNSKVT
jgi:hypothetical protein